MGNKIFTYKLRTFINASHAVRWQDGQGAEHPHTWELILDIRPNVGTEAFKFESIEQVMNASIEPFAGQFLNTVAPFDEINPTLENFTDILFDLITSALLEISCQLIELSVGESPTRFYHVTLDA
ncbi:MAG: 6-carboxytetrahydropterin synthase [Leuconostoc sp.]|uniref:6-carboxytetrahydropterin synthase n=1 Tax=Leuconostoc sp. TaxID=1930076 RepID=UPI0039E79BA5